MRRFALLLFVVLVGLGGYFWYRGDAPLWLAAIKGRLFPKDPAAGAPVPGVAREDEIGIAPASAELPYRDALVRLDEGNMEERVQAWSELTDAYLSGQPDVQKAVRPKLEEFVGTYVLSPRHPGTPRIAERVNVREGDALAKIAHRCGTTVEAIKRFNDLQADIIRPGLTLKVLNQKIELFVDKSRFTLWATYGGKFLLEMRCGIGKENRTEEGKFTIAERIVNPDWFPADKKAVPAGDEGNELGSRWLGFKDSGLGIHEAKNADDIGKACSNGCIRLVKDDIEKLYDVVPIGTPVTIRD